MDYLDPEKRRRHHRIMMVGYLLIAVVILGVTYLLINLTYGYARGKDGQIIQNGFVYLSSRPASAQIYLDDKLYKAQTNTRMILPAGRYTVRLVRDGYRTWQRSVTVAGGDVQHFDYPFLVPTTLTTTSLHAYPAAPGLVTQSPDQRWLLVQQAGSSTAFDLYDLKNPAKAPVSLTLPGSVVTAGKSQSWKLVEWADDNRHVLLEHLHDGAREFVVVDRAQPAQSVNLNTLFAAAPSAVSLHNKKYDQYYLYQAGRQLLQTASLGAPTPRDYLQNVLAYKPYGSDTVLYASDQGAGKGRATVRLQVGDRNYLVRDIAASPVYLLEMASYNGQLYVAAGSQAENRLYVYKDPAGQLDAKPDLKPVPLRALRLKAPTYVSFSKNAQFIMTEAGSAVAVYDIKNANSYNYELKTPLDPPQKHLYWMDGDRLAYVGHGAAIMLDYDHTNVQVLMSAAPAYPLAFAPDYKYIYALSSAAHKQYNLTQTALLTPADL